MNIEVANHWPLALVSLPKEKALQNEFLAPISVPKHPNPTIFSDVSVIESNEFWAKGSFIDIYV